MPLLVTEEAWQTTDLKVSELSTKEVTLRDLDTSFYQLNTGKYGYYRVNYPAARLASLAQNKDKLSIADKGGIISDAAAMAISGYGSTGGLLSFLSALGDETSY